MAREFTEKEHAVLSIVQKNLPDSLTPFADIAEAASMSEDEVLGLLGRLKEDGAIRRFGASIKHQEAGWTYNAMVAWNIHGEDVDALGTKAAEHPLISHCYYRPSPVEDWPYELYTMIHGRTPEEYKNVVAELIHQTALREYAVLESLQELKKTSMAYF